MRTFALSLVVFAAGCASTPAGLLETRVEESIVSQKTPQNFATCVAENMAGDVELRSAEGRYWVLVSVFDTPRHRWDFSETPNGSIAELRSTGFAGAGKGTVENCS